MSDRARATGRTARLGGLLLTGGASARMGRDKATLEVGGLSLAVRTGRLLAAIAAPVLEVGPGASELEAVREDPPGQGPLVALVAGAAALRTRGHDGPLLLVACDLPMLSTAALARLAEGVDDRSVVPVVGGFAQPLCARYATDDLLVASALVNAGTRSMRALLGAIDADLLELDGEVEIATALTDVDTPEDLLALFPDIVPPGEAGTLA